MTMTDSIPRFDGASVWATLTPEQRDAIGAAALDLACAWYAQEKAPDAVFARAADTAEGTCFELLRFAVVESVPHDRFESPIGRPLIPQVLGDVCRYCGCSQNDACDEGCGWSEPGVCTSCASEHAEITNA